MAYRKRSKYGVDITSSGKEKRTYKGVTYDSLLEMQFFREYVEPRLESGEIRSCKRQVTYTLQDGFTKPDGKKVLPIKYKSDFDIEYSDGRFVVYDVKGNPDNLSLLKRKLFWFRYPNTELVFICRCLKYGGWIEYDELKKRRKEDKNRE